MPFKSGFVSLIGNPNVGKSTLLNGLLGQKLSIITPKPQTTRHRIPGILNGKDYQVVFSDLPGIVKPAYKLHERMMEAVRSSLDDSDVFLLMTDIYQSRFNDEKIIEAIRKTGKPHLLILNKTDRCDEKTVESKMQLWNKVFPGIFILPLSALTGHNLTTLIDEIIKRLPENLPYYPEDSLTDRNERFFVSEIIREKILFFYQREVPYCCEVAIEEFREKPEITVITAFIIVMRESQKMIILGHKGNAVKKLGTAARKDIERFLQKKVFLDLRVKVKKEWRDDEEALRRMGY